MIKKILLVMVLLLATPLLLALVWFFVLPVNRLPAMPV